MIKKAYKDELVTRGHLEDFGKTLKSSIIADLIKEERAMLHEALLESFENAKAYHQKETDRYIKSLMEEWREESKGFHDYMRGIKDIQDTHERRITDIELSIA